MEIRDMKQEDYDRLIATYEAELAGIRYMESRVAELFRDEKASRRGQLAWIRRERLGIPHPEAPELEF